MPDMDLDLLVDMNMDLDDSVILDMDLYSETSIPMEVDREGGGSGTSDYNALTNKPRIEGVTLKGDKSFKQLGLEPMTPQDIDNILFG